MRANVAKKDLLPALTRTVSIADKKSVVPILSHVLLEFCNSGLRVKATDLDHSLLDIVPAEISTFGTVAVPAVTLYDIIRKSPDDVTLEFSLSDKGNRCVISSEKSRFDLAALDHADFPEINILDAAEKFTVPSFRLNKLISRTRFAISPEENRLNLSGIYFHREDVLLKAAATDGHRLSTSYIDAPAGNVPGVIISRKTIFEVKKLLDVHGGDVSLTFSNNQVQFEIGDTILISKLIDGKFPEYKKVIPEMSQDFFIVNRAKFLEIIDRLSVMSDDKLRIIKLELNKNILLFHVSNNRLGSAKSEIALDYSGQSWSAGFNANYLMDVASALGGEILKVYIKGSLAPILIVDESEPESLFVIMPMRI
ncbi:MAG: DNA polymerase III subunit beta [Holosporaceae bacterium]|jgi:DNA polymerase-3 subunit beta|nr:DNA polymerase III subunit beta [Holosporaceae bacterium]